MSTTEHGNPAALKRSGWAAGLASAVLAASLVGPAAAGPLVGAVAYPTAASSLFASVAKPIIDINSYLLLGLPYRLGASSVDFGPTAVATQKVLRLSIEDQ